MISPRQRIVATLDKTLDQCVESWRAMVVLVPAGTFVFFALVLFFGLTVAGALAVTKVLVALELVLAGAVLVLHLKYRHQISQWLDAADAIEAMLSNDDVFSDWDDFIADPASDPEFERIRLHCLTLPQEFPPAEPNEYCNQQGIEVLHGYVRRLRTGLATRAVEACAGLWSAWRASKNPADAELGDATPPDDPDLETVVKPRVARKTTKPTTRLRSQAPPRSRSVPRIKSPP